MPVLSATSRPGEGFWGLGDELSRLGESGLPKRDVLVMFWCFACISGQASLKCIFGREMISPKRDNLMLLLF